MKKKLHPFDIALIGSGTRGLKQLTVEQLELLEASSTVILSPGIGQDLKDFVKSQKNSVVDLEPYYQEGKSRQKVYREIASCVIGEAKKEGGILFIQYGHPMIYSKPSRLILKMAKKEKLRVIVKSGISSLAEIMSILRLDIRDRDVQIFHAEHLIKEKKKINPYVDLFLMHVGMLGDTKVARNKTKRLNRSEIGAYPEFQRYLEKFYPPNHQVMAITLNQEDPGQDIIINERLKDIEKLAPLLHYGHTLYLKALPKKKS